jgi:hypothetical protein
LPGVFWAFVNSLVTDNICSIIFLLTIGFWVFTYWDAFIADVTAGYTYFGVVISLAFLRSLLFEHCFFCEV